MTVMGGQRFVRTTLEAEVTAERPRERGVRYWRLAELPRAPWLHLEVCSSVGKESVVRGYVFCDFSAVQEAFAAASCKWMSLSIYVPGRLSPSATSSLHGVREVFFCASRDYYMFVTHDGESFLIDSSISRPTELLNQLTRVFPFPGHTVESRRRSADLP